jgi:uncharacterized membrane protein
MKDQLNLRPHPFQPDVTSPISMSTLLRFLKTTLIGGLLIVLPVWVTILLLLKAINGAVGMLRPIARLLPQTVVHEDLVALGLLILACFVTGLLIRTGPGQGLRGWLSRHVFEHIPGFTLMRGMTRQLAGDVTEQSFHPALVEIEDALVPAFIVEKHADGQLTVFVSSSPTPMAGAIYILPSERVHPVDMPLHKALACISKWGTGAAAMRAAMLSGSGHELEHRELQEFPKNEKN